MNSLARSCQFVHVPPDATAATTYALAAGTTAVNSGSIDLNGTNAATVVWKVTFGANLNTGTFSIQIQHSDDNSAWTSITGAVASMTDAAAASSNQVLLVEPINPTKRYMRAVLTRGVANTTVAHLEAIINETREQPNTQSTAAGQFAAAPVIVAVS